MAVQRCNAVGLGPLSPGRARQALICLAVNQTRTSVVRAATATPIRLRVWPRAQGRQRADDDDVQDEDLGCPLAEDERREERGRDQRLRLTGRAHAEQRGHQTGDRHEQEEQRQHADDGTAGWTSGALGRAECRGSARRAVPR